MKHLLVSSILFLTWTANLFAQQKQGAWWYFGDKAGLNFNANPPVPDLSGNSTSSFGSASISDANGYLLIYSDGINIYDRNHQVMPNGGNLGPAVASAMLVQKPGNTFLYYLFMIDQIRANNPPNFTYTLIDMRLNGGNGAVVNNQMKVVINNAEMAYKLTACLHSNNRDIWIISHSRYGNVFYSFLLSPSGLSQPIISNAGFSYIYQTPSGSLKSSPNSQMVCDAIHFSNITQLLDFDRTSGSLTNARNFAFNTGPWGISFSPDNTKLYLNDSYNIYQYNLLASNFQSILSSKIKIDKNLISGDYLL